MLAQHQVFWQENCLNYPQDCVGQVTETLIVSVVRAVLTVEHLLCISHTLYLRLNVVVKPSTFLAISLAYPRTNYEHLKYFITLATHSLSP